jgi:mono/diheme cytochrome c family protein
MTRQTKSAIPVTSILALLLMFAGTGAAAQAADAGEGERLARQWCSECHLVGPDESSASDIAPPFNAIAGDPAKTDADLRGWLHDPHPPMPNLNLSRTEVEDLISYIRSLPGDS